jgi:hypothetical protein
MKNIHVLPTDKPSRLSILNSGKLNFGAEAMSSSNSKPQHIYITSDEEVKEGDWFVHSSHGITNIYKAKSVVPESIITTCDNGCWVQYCKKIILTTDQDLIKDGVQAIYDEFLEWFVQNPSCESVSANKQYITPLGDVVDFCYDNERLNYKIIIPQEEPKQETIEEAAMSYLDRTYSLSYERTTWQKLHEKTFSAGAKWQAERMYSEEEVRLMFNRYNEFISHHDIEEWQAWIDKQFKKKGGDK